jgi:hypothetical protein
LRDGDTERLRGFQVHDQLELGRHSIGSSPGFAPFRVLSTNTAACLLRRRTTCTLARKQCCEA